MPTPSIPPKTHGSIRASIPGALRGLAGALRAPVAMLAVAAPLALGACAEMSQMMPATQAKETPSGQPAGLAKSFNRFPDIPVPTQSVMDVKRTLVFGGGETWYGQLGLNSKHDSDSMFDFYKQELPTFGWEEITSVRAPVSVLTYIRAERVLSIQVEKGAVGGSNITLTVSPKGGVVAQ